jgi:hypothetical protein
MIMSERPEGFKFNLWELVDPQSFTDYSEGCWNFFPEQSLYMLHGIRTYFNVPVTVNTWHSGGPFRYRGYRGPSCSIGALSSYHKRGMAWDFDVKDMTAEEVRTEIKTHQDDPNLELIQRMEAKVTWCHADTGDLKEGQHRIYLFEA